MTDLELFDSRGQFQMPPAEVIASMDDDVRERWLSVAEASAETSQVEADLKAAESHVQSLIEETRELETEIRTRWPGQTREQAIREFLATERAKRNWR